MLFAVSAMLAMQGCSGSRDETHARQVADRVRTEFLHAWNNYERYAWGHDHLRPLSKTAHDWYGQSLLMTPVDALDTLVLMNLDAEAAKTRSLIVNELSFDRDVYVKNFEVTIRLLGGLLSSYQLTGDKRLLNLAEDLGTRLLPVFDSPTGLPYVYVNLRSGDVRDTVTNPAETGTLLLEFGTLSKLTGKPIFYEKAKRAVVETYKRCSAIGLVGSIINVETGVWADTDSHISGGIDSYYEYLWKCWRLFGDKDCRDMWHASIPAVHKYLADEKSGECGTGTPICKRVNAERRLTARSTHSFRRCSRFQVTSRERVDCKLHPSRCGTCTASNLKSSITKRCALSPAAIICVPRLLNPLTICIVIRAIRSIAGWVKRSLTISSNIAARMLVMPRSPT
jgi:hypothetical protein